MPRKTSKSKLSRSQRAAKLVIAGTHSHVEAANEFGLTRAAVSAVLRAQGIHTGTTARGRATLADKARNPSRRWREVRASKDEEYRRLMGFPDPSLILKEHESGNSFTQIAARHGLTKGQVAGYVFRARKAVAS